MSSYRVRAQERASTLQEQEMHQYYQPWLAAHGSAVNVASNVDSIAAPDLQERGYRARASRDKALMAFAQLATLRLGIRRCMISLIDSKNQYILAEATRSVSLMTDRRHNEDDELWLGSTIVRRDDAVCHHCFMSTYSIKGDNDMIYEARALVVDDCRQDDRFKDRSYVVSEPGVRFYAGVPIITRSGHAIGVYGVSDEKPRAGLSLDELRFMQDIASAVLEHLEWARDRVDRFKGERIVKGLASFIDCSTTISHPQKSHRSRVDGNGIEYSYEEDTAMSNDSQDESARRSASRRVAFFNSKLSKVSETESEAESVVSVDSTSSTASASRGGKYTQNSDEDNIAAVIARAARVLRKATLADGVVFFGLNGTSNDAGPLSPVIESQESDYLQEPDGKRPVPLCRVLGSSLGRATDKQNVLNTGLTVSSLEKYLKAYPEGKTLYFTHQGLGMESGDESASEGHASDRPSKQSSPKKEREGANTKRKDRSNRKRKARMSHVEILDKLPGVRTLIFLPLRDLSNNKWLAGGFLWTCSAGRMMNLDTDFSYLKAFGNSICSEVARTNVEKLDRAKMTFIASMSHELRSPLHGILGSVEFLQDTETDSYQTGLVTSIANCSRTLLDTLSNLLSYAKVSTIESASAARDDLDLGVLVEEVVEAVCAGHTFKKLHTGNMTLTEGANFTDTLYNAAKFVAGKLHSDDMDDMNHSPEGTLTILLDLAPSVSWNVSTNPGALRRIIMNLVGNALKYTSTGFVAVSLRAKQVDKKIETILRVVDSGKGISEEFQRNHLFVPFKQEDTFASGTGLGLSIVKQLVESLDGTIQVRSAVGQGTEIEVGLSLTPANGGIGLPADDILEVAAKTKGLRLCVLDPNEEKQAAGSEHIARLDKTLGETCSTWFGMEITTADNMTKANTDMFLYTEPPSLEYLLEHHSGDDAGRVTPLIIVCMNAQEAISISHNQLRKLGELGRIVEVIPQPCGPRKLSKILSHCMDRVDQITRENPSIKTGRKGSSPGDDKEALGEDQEHMDQDSESQIGPRSTPDSQGGASEDTRPLLAKSRTTSLRMSEAVAFPGAPPPLISPRALSYRSLNQAPNFEMPKEAKVLHILLVDDNKINVDLLVRFVRKFKLSCEEAYNGQEAVDKYKKALEDKKPFDCILMDISMPVMDGIEATKQIRSFEEIKQLHRTKIIALSAFASTDTQTEAKAGGVDVYMPKPVKFGELKKMLLDNQDP